MKVKETNFIKYVIISSILLIIPVMSPNSYFMQIINMAGLYLILAMGFNILRGYAGLLTLGQAAFYAVGAYTTAIMNTKLGTSFAVNLLASVIVTCVVGLIIAIPALKVKGSYLAVLTLGFGEIVRLVLVNWISFTNGPSGILNIDSPIILGFNFDTLEKFYYIILFFVIILSIYQIRLANSRVGRAMKALRDDDDAAELMGVDIVQYKIKAFLINSAYCGIAGCLYAQMFGFVSPDSFISAESITILCMVIIGGVGTFIGPIFGAVILTFAPEILRPIDDWRMVIYGVLLIICIRFFPGGLASLYYNMMNYFKQKWVKFLFVRKKDKVV